MMNKYELLNFMIYRLYLKVKPMQGAERAAYLMDIFGISWAQVYADLIEVYPDLVPSFSNPLHSFPIAEQKEKA